MTTPTYTINGSITFHGVRSTWTRSEKRTNNDGTIDYQPYAVNTWDIEQAEMATYLSLLALSGKTLSSLATNDITDRNEAATYSAGVEVGIVNCQQVGQRAIGIKAEFRVKV